MFHGLTTSLFSAYCKAHLLKELLISASLQIPAQEHIIPPFQLNSLGDNRQEQHQPSVLLHLHSKNYILPEKSEIEVGEACPVTAERIMSCRGLPLWDMGSCQAFFPQK